MKKFLALFTTIALLVSFAIMPTVGSAEFAGFDFEGSYAFYNYASTYYITKGNMLVFMESAGNDEQTAKSYIIKDGENGVLSLPQSVRTNVGRTGDDTLTMRIKKVSSEGSFTLSYNTSIWTNGANRGGQTISLFTLDGNGNILDNGGMVVDQYNTNEWLDVSIRLSSNRQQANIVLEKANGDKVYATMNLSQAPTIPTEADKASYVFSNSGSTVYVDDLNVTTAKDEFILDNPYGTDADVDYEQASGYNWAFYRSPYFESNGTLYFSTSAADINAAKAEIVKDNGDHVMSLNSNSGTDLRILRQSSDGYSYEFKVKKLAKTGTFDVTYAFNTYGDGSGGTEFKLFTLDASGNVLNSFGNVAGTYTENEWYTVKLSHHTDNLAAWNVSLTNDSTAAVVGVSTIGDISPSASNNSVIGLANNGSSVYVDDISVKKTQSFMFDDSNGLYTYNSNITDIVTAQQSLPDGSKIGGAYFWVQTGATATLSPFTSGNKKAVKVSATRSANSNVNTTYNIPAANVRNPFIYSVKFIAGVNTLGSENYVTANIYNGNNIYSCKLLEFASGGGLNVYQTGYNANAEMTATPIIWKADALYECELIHDYKNRICRFYITDVDGTTYGYSFDNQQISELYLQGINYNFRAYSGTPNAYYIGDASMNTYAPNCQYAGFVPANGTVNAYLNTYVDVNYSDYLKDADYSSVITFADEDGKAVPYAAKVYGKTLRITPTSELSKGVTYTVTVGAVYDLFGNTVAAAGSTSFETARAMEITNYKLNGSENGDVVKGNNTLSVDISAGDGDYSGVVCAAAYEKATNQLVAFDAVNWSIAQFAEPETINLAVDLSGKNGSADDYEISVFVWDGFTQMKAYTDKVVFDNIQ